MKYILKSISILFVFLLLYETFIYLEKISELLYAIGLLFFTPAFLFLFLWLFNRRYVRKPVVTSLLDLISFAVTYMVLYFLPIELGLEGMPDVLSLVLYTVSMSFIFVVIMSLILWIRDLYFNKSGQK